MCLHAFELLYKMLPRRTELSSYHRKGSNLQPIHLLSTLSLALLERRAASVAWHSYSESSDKSAWEISKLYWPMSRARRTRYLGHAVGHTHTHRLQLDHVGWETANGNPPPVIHTLGISALGCIILWFICRFRKWTSALRFKNSAPPGKQNDCWHERRLTGLSHHNSVSFNTMCSGRYSSSSFWVTSVRE